MNTSHKLCISILLAGLACVASAAPPSLPHDEFMPPDRHGVRVDRPEQMLLQIDNYRITVASESRQVSVGRMQESSLWLFLEGHSLAAGSDRQKVHIGFVEAADTVPAARLDAVNQTLTLYYPLSYLQTLVHILNGPGPHFVQARMHGNGTVWADVHAGPISIK